MNSRVPFFVLGVFAGFRKLLPLLMASAHCADTWSVSEEAMIRLLLFVSSLRRNDTGSPLQKSCKEPQRIPKRETS
jgi:hypothetical protein